MGAFISWSGTGLRPDGSEHGLPDRGGRRSVAGAGRHVDDHAATLSACRPRWATAAAVRPIWWVATLSVFKGVVQVFQVKGRRVMLVMQMLGDREHVLRRGPERGRADRRGAGLSGRPQHAALPPPGAGVRRGARHLLPPGVGLNACWFALWSVLFFVVCFVSQPLAELAFSPIQSALVMDRAVRRDGSCGYAYLCGYEMGLYAGRLFGGGVFIGSPRCCR